MLNATLQAAEVKRAFRILRKTLGNLSGNAAIKQAKRRAAKPLISAAQRNVPVKSGFLRQSIGFLDFSKSNDVFIGPKIGKQKIRRSVKSGKRLKRRRKQRVKVPFYALFIEGGTKNFKGYKYMKKAFDSTKGEVRRRLLLSVNDQIKKAINSAKQ